MTIDSFNQDERDQLLQIVAEEFPVFVLGPGCYRVGFDNPDDTGWSAVENRVADILARLQFEEQKFLREFFFSKLSDERRGEPHWSAVERRLDELTAASVKRWDEEEERANATDSAEHQATAAAATQFDPWRTLLATRLLQAFRNASCCLGLVIGEGRSPVVRWQDATVPTETIGKWLEGDAKAATEDEDNPRRHFLASGQAIQSAAYIARAMDRLTRGERLNDEQMGALQELPLSGLDLGATAPEVLVSALASPLEVLLPSRIATMLEVLDDKCFKPEFEPLRGANVEWLGDLLWHVLSSDAEVQPSQAELAFYVTLSARKGRHHDLGICGDPTTAIAWLEVTISRG